MHRHQVRRSLRCAVGDIHVVLLVAKVAVVKLRVPS